MSQEHNHNEHTAAEQLAQAAADATAAASIAAQAAASTVASALPNAFGKTLNKPSEYDGKDRNACTTFVSQVRMYINGNPGLFLTDAAMVLFAATYLKGKAFAWMEPRIIKNVDPMLSNFDLFCQELLRNLGDPDREKTMSKRLRSLKQTTSAAAYRTEFDNIAQYLTWDDGALKEYFYEGLKEAVKDSLVLVPQEPDDFKLYQDLCIKLDNRIYERKQEHRGPRQTTSANPHKADHKRPNPVFRRPPVTVNNYSSGPTAMDLDASRNRKFKPLTPQERQHRMQNNLCLYCGKAGHRAGDCPAKQNRPVPNRLQATLVGPMDKAPAKSEN